MKFIKCESVYWKEGKTFQEGEPLILNSSYIESIEKISPNFKLTPEAENKYSEKFDVSISELCILQIRLASKKVYNIVTQKKDFDNFKN